MICVLTHDAKGMSIREEMVTVTRIFYSQVSGNEAVHQCPVSGQILNTRLIQAFKLFTRRDHTYIPGIYPRDRSPHLLWQRTMNPAITRF